MSTILGVYSLKNRLNPADVRGMIETLGRFGKRFVSQVAFPGFLLASANELEGESAFETNGDTGLTYALVGTVADARGVMRPPVRCLQRAWNAHNAGRDGAKPADQIGSVLRELEGAFIAVVYDAKEHRLHIANDKFGVRPIFIAQEGDLVAFCNEIEPLQNLPSIKRELYPEAIADYFCLGTTLGEETFFKGIQNLTPGSVRTYAHRKFAESQYWTPDIAVDRKSSIEDHAARIAELMRTIVPQIPDQLTNLNCLVSAGADSRLILSCLRPDQLESIPFLTSKLSILEANDDRDLIGATALAQRLGLHHRIIEIAFSERDFGPQYFDEVKAAREAKILGGWHGGEFLGGYCAKGAPISDIPPKAQLNRMLRDHFLFRFWFGLTANPHQRLRWQLRRMTAENASLQFQIQQFTRAFFSTIYGGSRGSWLQPFEIINQGHSPFWDSRFLATLLEVPSKFLADYQLYNVIFRDHLTALTDIPSNSPLTLRPDTAIPPMTAGTEPKAALRPKYQNALNAYAAEAQSYQLGLYRISKIQAALSDGEADFTKRFVDFEAWVRRFLGKEQADHKD